MAGLAHMLTALLSRWRGTNIPQTALPAMDAEHAAVYAAEYSARATMRNVGSSALSTAAKISKAATKPTATALTKFDRAERAASMTVSGFFGNLLWAILMLVTWPLRALHHHILLPLFSGIVSLVLTIFYAVFWIALAFTLLLVVIYTPSFARYMHEEFRLRERWDDFALNNQVILNLEHGYASFKRAMYDRYLSLMYNPTMDSLRRFWFEFRRLPDRVEAFFHQYILWMLLALLVGILLWPRPEVDPYDGLLTMEQRRELDIKMNSLPDWIAEGRQGSVWRFEPAKPIADDQWVAALGGRDDEPVAVTTSKTSSTSTSTSSTSSKQTAAHWAMPTDGKTTLGEDEMRWCRGCQQYHCCELPY
ncbi:hypothetical protein LTR22_006335 [Elasticomyces elasticus]|nr:hypothetical protein LTR22_006335 [Elasticomyces elasticus]